MHQRGFTLVELLVVIGIIGTLASITIKAINPARQLAQARNAQRRSDVKAIADALHQSEIDNRSSLVAGLDDNWRMLGTDIDGCAVSCGEEAAAGSPTSVILYPSADSSIWQAASSTNYGSDSSLWTYPWMPSWSRRALIKFDLSGIGSASEINSATLNMFESQTYGVARIIGTYSVTQDWSEGGVTWNSRDGTNAWNSAGGSFTSSATDSQTVLWGGSFSWDSWDVTSDVVNFVNGSQNNYGWLIKTAVEDTSQAYWFFHSKDTGTPAYRPYLEVNYTPSGMSGDTTESACLNLESVLVNRYLPSIPEDPIIGSGAKTYYAVRKTAQDRVAARACAAELNEDIIVAR